jgi:isopenicillin N synthase-like dioxygenase
MQPDFSSIQRLFDTLYCSPTLVSRLNIVQSRLGVFNYGGKWVGDTAVDNKATFDLSARVLRSYIGTSLKREMGSDFETVMKFFETVEERLIPMVLQATSDAISTPEGDIWDVHRDGNNNFRLIDYHRSSAPRPGAREHRDPNTATIIFQDGSGGLEIQDPSSGVWRSVPGDETVVMWGRSGHVLSGRRIAAVNHRVSAIQSTRRNTAVCFISPDLDASLQHVVWAQAGNIVNRAGRGTFRNIVEQRRWREGLRTNQGRR